MVRGTRPVRVVAGRGNKMGDGMTEISVTSDFAILDIKSGRAKVSKALGGNWEENIPSHHKIPVTIKGYIVAQYSGDDGVSREFKIDVSTVKLGKPVRK